VGGTSEIGLATVRALVGDHEADVALAGRPGPALERAAQLLQSSACSVRTFDYDASWPADRVEDLLVQAERAVGPVDTVLVAVGMLGTPAVPPALAEPGLRDLLTANLVGPALVANAAVELLARHGRGQLVVVTSAAAARPRDEILGYAVAKQALDSFVRGLDRRARRRGVRCLVVRPGRVRTRMTTGLAPAPLTVGPDQVAARIRAAVTRRSGVVWVPAVVGPVTLALRAIPSRVLPRTMR
jgi:decaprenylphospho-beta-D-erythro-pentofuranosid-2-ulose 2-reductase